jgi:uncharacterized damage-inducible protein DinB
MLKRALAILALAASPLAAQGSPASAIANARMLWEDVAGYLVQSATDMPAEKYGYKPTPAVRSFGELIGHVAGSQNMFCAMALGEKPPAEDAVEKAATTKEALVQALQASNESCRRAYAQGDADASGTVSVFGRQQSRLYVLMMNATHDNEHYGNVVTYLRMNGIVPPSSRPRSGS